MKARSSAHLMALIAVLTASSVYAAASPTPCTKARYRPAKGQEQEAVGGRFEGSNRSWNDGFVLLGEIKSAPAPGQWAEVTFENKVVYRWLRYLGPEHSHATAGKAEFFAGDLLLADENKTRPYHGFKKDADDYTMIGYDLFDSAGAPRPGIKPDEETFDTSLDVTLTPSKGGEVRYTLDGSWPAADHGEVYTAPIHIEKTTTISAVGILPGRGPGIPLTKTYLRKSSVRPSLVSAHIGNSLTGTAAGFWRFARTAGFDHKQSSFLRGGALTRELWALSSSEFASDAHAAAKEKASLEKGSTPWASFWGKIGKVDLITLQPRDFDLDKEVAADANFIKLFRQKSPDLQPWLYCEWVELRRDRPSDKGEVPSYQMHKTFPALTWEESMSAMLLYVEELQHRLDGVYHDGKRARVLPAALAMGWIHNQIDQGQFPGVDPGSFYTLLFNDQVHPADSPVHKSANGAFLVDMTWYSAFYREAPDGRVLPIETTYTPEQTRAVERLAWDVIKNYPDCGLYEEGTEPCGKPEIVKEGKKITLRSATPGAWFRYTLDGTEPSRTRGYVYCGVISDQPGITVKAIAYKSGMADSPVVGN